jgi:hypothetical protein
MNKIDLFETKEDLFNYLRENHSAMGWEAKWGNIKLYDLGKRELYILLTIVLEDLYIKKPECRLLLSEDVK